MEIILNDYHNKVIAFVCLNLITSSLMTGTCPCVRWEKDLQKARDAGRKMAENI